MGVSAVRGRRDPSFAPKFKSVIPTNLNNFHCEFFIIPVVTLLNHVSYRKEKKLLTIPTYCEQNFKIFLVDILYMGFRITLVQNIVVLLAEKAREMSVLQGKS